MKLKITLGDWTQIVLTSVPRRDVSFFINTYHEKKPWKLGAQKACEKAHISLHGFGNIYWKNPEWKTLFFVQCLLKYSLNPCKISFIEVIKSKLEVFHV